VLRARDFATRLKSFGAGVEPYLVRSPDEEMGFRTLGWPEKLEEIGLYFAACDGVIELSLYRERGRRMVGADALDKLRALGAPLAAAFDTHARVAAQANRAATPLTARLSPREAQITELLLRGCGSRAISLRLDISVHTVKDHRKSIFRKLGVGTLAQLFALHVAPPPRRDSASLRAATG
jgi:DNA-binding CsgD family transcriptional regulator